MPASDTAHLGIPPLPRSVVTEGLLRGWLEMAEFAIALDDVTDTYDTGETILANLPADIFLTRLEYRVVAPFVGDSELAQVYLEFGDSVDYKLFGAINQGMLNSTNSYGSIPINYHATGTDGISLAMFNHELGDTVLSSGTLELKLFYRLDAGQPRLNGNKAR